MNTNRIAPFLVGVLLCLSLCATWLSARHFFSLKELQKLQGRYVRMNNTIRTAQLLFAQCREYSKTNSDILPILQQFEWKPATNTLPELPQSDTSITP